jgi:hypothetical protein
VFCNVALDSPWIWLQRHQWRVKRVNELLLNFDRYGAFVHHPSSGEIFCHTRTVPGVVRPKGALEQRTLLEQKQHSTGAAGGEADADDAEDSGQIHEKTAAELHAVRVLVPYRCSRPVFSLFMMYAGASAP